MHAAAWALLAGCPLAPGPHAGRLRSQRKGMGSDSQGPGDYLHLMKGKLRHSLVTSSVEPDPEEVCL